MLKKQKTNVKIQIDDNKEKNDLNNYKGQFYKEGSETKFFEAGAHFEFKDLCKRLESLNLNSFSETLNNFIYEEDNPIAMNCLNLKENFMKKKEAVSLKIRDNKPKEVMFDTEHMSSQNIKISTKHKLNNQKSSNNIESKLIIKFNPSLIKNIHSSDFNLLKKDSNDFRLKINMAKTQRKEGKLLPSVTNKTRNAQFIPNYNTYNNKFNNKNNSDIKNTFFIDSLKVHESPKINSNL